MFNASVNSPFAARFDYELLDLAKFGRASDETVAITKLFGPPQGVPESAAPGRSRDVPLLIIGDDEGRVMQGLHDQRSGKGSSVGGVLRPIAVIGPNRDLAQRSLSALADIVLGPGPTVDALRDMRAVLTAVSAATAALPVEHGDHALLLMQYLCSRERTFIEPFVTPTARLAYRYPVAESVLATSTGQALDVLNDLAEYRLLDAQVVDRVFLCPHCNGYRVPVKELCRECHSPDISLQNSIHHFRCGYVGPESAFGTEGSLRCPKCRAYLRHVGVEYNHPGHIVTCNACNYWAAEPLLQAWCVDCNRCMPPEQLKSLRISRFKLTPRGVRAARAGCWNPNQAQAPLTSGRAATGVAASADAERQREVARTVLRIARANHWKIAAYRIEVDTRAVTASDAGQAVDGSVDEIRQWATRQLGSQALVAPLGEREILVLGANGRRNAVPASATLARSLKKSVHCRTTVSALKVADATELLAVRG